MGRVRGHTMVEAIVGAFILWFVVLAMALMFQGSLFVMEKASCTVQANAVAEADIDAERAKGFNNLVVGSRDLPDRMADGIVYHSKLEVFEVADEPAVSKANLRGIRATVTWRLRGVDRSLVRESWMSCVKS